MARQRYCRPLARYRNTLASLPTPPSSQLPRPARKAGFSTFEKDCGRETDCLLEGDGFEPSVPRERSLLLPRSELARRNRLAAGTGCRLQRAKVSAYSNVSNGAEREPPDLRMSLLAGAHAVGPGQQVAAAGLVRPIFPGAPGLDRIGAVAPVAGLDLALRQVLDSGRPAAALASARVRCAAGRPIAARPRSAKRAVEANP